MTEAKYKGTKGKGVKVSRRGTSCAALDSSRWGGYDDSAGRIEADWGIGKKPIWTGYSRAAVLIHTRHVPAATLRFLQYVTTKTRGWWADHQPKGAVLLGKAAEATSQN